MTTQVWHDRFAHWGDLVDASKSAAIRAIAVVAGVLLVPAVVWGAVQIAGVAAEGLDPSRMLAFQIVAAVLSAAGIIAVLVGIDRFNRRTPMVKR